MKRRTFLKGLGLALASPKYSVEWLGGNAPPEAGFFAGEVDFQRYDYGNRIACMFTDKRGMEDAGLMEVNVPVIKPLEGVAIGGDDFICGNEEAPMFAMEKRYAFIFNNQRAVPPNRRLVEAIIRRDLTADELTKLKEATSA
jgi:hypothetical protein